MADTAAATGQAMFDAWKKQMEESTQAWARAVSGGGHAADPLQMWRPFMEQASQGWTAMAQQGVPATDIAAQWKALMDQWLNAWDQVLTKAMGTEQFAQALSAHLDQWLAMQAPLRKATKESRDAALEAFGVPSREQVIGIARQIMDLDDRLEDVERGLKALLNKLEAGTSSGAAAKGAGGVAAKRKRAHNEAKGEA
jgi:hypothetical protein